jgi:D-amino-acid dehydrogenase
MEARNTADVLVVGGGIVGTSVAVALQERGRGVILIDPGVNTRRATFGNAGMINRASLFPVAGPHIWRNLSRYVRNADPSLHLDHKNILRVYPWLWRFLANSTKSGWRRAATALAPLTGAAWAEHARLANLAGANALLDRCGWIRLYRSEEAFARTMLEREILGSHGISFEVFAGNEIQDLEPALTRSFARAILYPEMTLIRNPDSLLAAYQRLFIHLGGRVIQAEAFELKPDGEEWLTRWHGGEAKAHQAVLATGAWSGGMAHKLGYHFPLAAERGYHRHFTPAGPRQLKRPVHDASGGCVVCPMETGLRVLCGVELAPRDAPKNTRLIDGAEKAAAQMVALGEPIEPVPWIGARPSTPDGLPIIGMAPRHFHLAFAFGHGHIGMSTGPATGQVVADMLQGVKPAIPIDAFSPSRF